MIDDHVVPFPDGLTVADVLARGLDAAHELYARVTTQVAEPVEAPALRQAQGRDSPLADVRLLAPLVPAAIRDFVAFEEHVEGISASVDGKSEVVPEWYQLPTFYFTNPHTVLGPGRADEPAGVRTARLRARDRRRDRRGGGVGWSEPDTGGRGIPHLRLHDHERLVRARPAVPRDEGAARAGEGQGLRHLARTVDRHGR